MKRVEGGYALANAVFWPLTVFKAMLQVWLPFWGGQGIWLEVLRKAVLGFDPVGAIKMVSYHIHYAHFFRGAPHTQLKWLLPRLYQQGKPILFNCTPQKSGSSLLSYALFLINNDTSTVPPGMRHEYEMAPFINVCSQRCMNAEQPGTYHLLKMHFGPKKPVDLLARPQDRVVVMCRDLSKQLLSAHEFFRLLRRTTLGFEDYVRCTAAGFWFDDYFAFLKQGLELANAKAQNVCLLNYEDWLEPTRKEAALRKLCAFMGRPVTDDRIKALMRATSKEFMSKDPSVKDIFNEESLPKSGAGDVVYPGFVTGENVHKVAFGQRRELGREQEALIGAAWARAFPGTGIRCYADYLAKLYGAGEGGEA